MDPEREKLIKELVEGLEDFDADEKEKINKNTQEILFDFENN
jgi:hypothetical protein